jgi:hypothetical protein
VCAKLEIEYCKSVRGEIALSACFQLIARRMLARYCDYQTILALIWMRAALVVQWATTIGRLIAR